MVPHTIFGYSLGQIRKTVEASLGLVLVVAAAITGATTDLPAWATSAIAVVVAVGTGVRVFMVQNAPLLDTLTNSHSDLR